MSDYLRLYNAHYCNTAYRKLSWAVADCLGISANYTMIENPDQEQHNRFMVACQDAALIRCGCPHGQPWLALVLMVEALDYGESVLAALDRWLGLFPVCEVSNV